MVLIVECFFANAVTALIYYFFIKFHRMPAGTFFIGIIVYNRCCHLDLFTVRQLPAYSGYGLIPIKT